MSLGKIAFRSAMVLAVLAMLVGVTHDFYGRLPLWWSQDRAVNWAIQRAMRCPQPIDAFRRLSASDHRNLAVIAECVVHKDSRVRTAAYAWAQAMLDEHRLSNNEASTRRVGVFFETLLCRLPQADAESQLLAMELAERGIRTRFHSSGNSRVLVSCQGILAATISSPITKTEKKMEWRMEEEGSRFEDSFPLPGGGI